MTTREACVKQVDSDCGGVCGLSGESTWGGLGIGDILEPVTAEPGEQADVETLLQALDDLLRTRTRGPVSGEFVGRRGRHAPVPGSVVQVLERVTQAMARGDAVAVVSVGRELTTQQAADLLNVSRQYLVRLVDEGRIPSAKTGTHRRLRLADVLAFKAARDKARKASLRALTRATEAAGGYEAEQAGLPRGDGARPPASHRVHEE